MLRPLLAFLFVLPVAVLTGGEEPLRPLLPGEPTVDDMARARAVLTSWEKDAPRTARVCRIVYWSPADREPLPEYEARLSRVMKHIQEFYRREMAAWGFAGRTIQLETGTDGLVKIYRAKGSLKSAECSETDPSDGQAIRKDALQALQEQGQIDGDKETIVIFCNLADWDPEKRRMSHHSPYYASGNSQHGTAWQLDSPLLDAALLGEKQQHLHDGQYGHISLGKYNSIFIGGVCHELGHALGLPHCRASAAAEAARGTALMGDGNRTYGEEIRGESKGSFLSLPHALKLAAHPQFSGIVRGMDRKGTVAYSNWKLTAENASLRVTFRIEPSLPVHAVLAYADGEGGADYDSEIAVGIPQADGQVTLTLPPPRKKNVPAQVNIVTVFANGTATASVWSSGGFSLPVRFTGGPGYDITGTREKLALTEFVKARKSGVLTPEKLQAWGPRFAEAHERLSKPDAASGKPLPKDVPAGITSLVLSDAAPASAKTGWGGVHFDRRDSGEPFLIHSGLVTTGLWAHADSQFTYDLGGHWKKFAGDVAFLEGARGRVQASIFGDGRELWKSGELRADGAPASCAVDVSGISKLELKITCRGSNHSTWTIWANPRLER